MSETSQLVAALKQLLKAKGVTYRDIGRALKLSEASVKRIFAAESFSLARLEEICRSVDLTIYELTRFARAGESSQPSVLSEVQEKSLAQDPLLFAGFYLLLNGWTPGRVARRLDLAEPQITRLLTALDRLRLIELHPRNRVRILTARAIYWRKDGPVRRMYERQVKDEFLAADFEGADARFRFETGELSRASFRQLETKIDRLAREFEDLVEADSAQLPEDKKAVGLLVAFRPWVFSLFSKRRRQ